MGKIIYLISVLDQLKSVSILLIFSSIAILLVGGLLYLNIIDMLEESEAKSIKRFLKGAGIFFVVSTLATVLIPAKEEMYLMALTKDYKVEDVYRMTKDEIKGSIDYVFDKIEELKK